MFDGLWRNPEAVKPGHARRDNDIGFHEVYLSTA
jgi:hypothetical protein